MELEVDLFYPSGRGANSSFPLPAIEQSLKASFDSHFFSRGQMFVADVTGILLRFRVVSIELAFLSAHKVGTESPKAESGLASFASSSSSGKVARGMLIDSTALYISPAPSTTIKITGSDQGAA